MRPLFLLVERWIPHNDVVFLGAEETSIKLLVKVNEYANITTITFNE